MTRFIMYGKMTSNGAELAAEKAASNRERGRGSGPSHPLKKVGLAKSMLLGRMAVREASKDDDNIIGNMAYRKRKGGPPRRGRGSNLH